ncbi:hypothetical protein B0H16DRAFT_1471263 [Mycena metata]|uniref:Uncharacterized protein n=1 Tax=Mycena metata TaxID=1033252 RepID=A0AAD7HTF2_9AGAR|nr:hypothetical protein B0H16DRAFT_1471263 [Mycena metata]
MEIAPPNNMLSFKRCIARAECKPIYAFGSLYGNATETKPWADKMHLIDNEWDHNFPGSTPTTPLLIVRPEHRPGLHNRPLKVLAVQRRARTAFWNYLNKYTVLSANPSPLSHYFHRLWAPPESEFSTNIYNTTNLSSYLFTMSTPTSKLSDYFRRVPKCEADGTNWSIYKSRFIYAADAAGLKEHLEATHLPPVAPTAAATPTAADTAALEAYEKEVETNLEQFQNEWAGLTPVDSNTAQSSASAWLSDYDDEDFFEGEEDGTVDAATVPTMEDLLATANGPTDMAESNYALSDLEGIAYFMQLLDASDSDSEDGSMPDLEAVSDSNSEADSMPDLECESESDLEKEEIMEESDTESLPDFLSTYSDNECDCNVGRTASLNGPDCLPTSFTDDLAEWVEISVNEWISNQEDIEEEKITSSFDSAMLANEAGTPDAETELYDSGVSRHMSPRLVKDGLVTGIKLNGSSEMKSCASCEYGKMHRKPVGKIRKEERAAAMGDLIHSDVWGPSPTRTINGRDLLFEGEQEEDNQPLPENSNPNTHQAAVPPVPPGTPKQSPPHTPPRTPPTLTPLPASPSVAELRKQLARKDPLGPDFEEPAVEETPAGRSQLAAEQCWKDQQSSIRPRSTQGNSSTGGNNTGS